MRRLLYLGGAQRFGDLALLLQRVFVGAFLIWGVWDNIVSGERMREFEQFLRVHGFLLPELLAPVSVYVQFLVGVAFLSGWLTRWAGILCAVHFAVAIAMVDYKGGFRGIFPSGCLVAIGLYLASHGAGRFSLDELLRANTVPRSPDSVRLKT